MTSPSGQPSQGEARRTFFRQSGWVVFATLLNGVLMAAIHKAAIAMGQDHYGGFVYLLSVLGQLTIPTLGLQMTFAQDAAVAATGGHRDELRGALRVIFVSSVLLFLAIVGAGVVFQQELVAAAKLPSLSAGLLTLATALVSVWQPMFMGVLQGRQNFLWFGFAALANGLFRLGSILVLVTLLGGSVTAAMTGVLIGMLASTGVAAWQARDIFSGPPARFDWRPWLRRVSGGALLNSLSLGAITYLLTQDMITVQGTFSKTDASFYAAAGLIGRTLYYLITPMTYVLFSKVLHSSLRAEKTPVLMQALLAAGGVGLAAAFACYLLPELPLRILYDSSYLKVAPLLPLYALAMVPLTLSSVLVNSLLARRRYPVVGWLVAVAVGYGVALRYRHGSFEEVIQTLGLANALLLAGCFSFAWRARNEIGKPAAS